MPKSYVRVLDDCSGEWVRVCIKVGGAAQDDFALANDPTPHRPARFENGDKRQRVCVEGMGLLPGQLDLF
jgi:hypothetical protein